MNTFPEGSSLTEVRGGGTNLHPQDKNTTLDDNLFFFCLVVRRRRKNKSMILLLSKKIWINYIEQNLEIINMKAPKM